MSAAKSKVPYSNLEKLTKDKRALKIITGRTARSSKSILYSKLSIGIDGANVLVAWYDGVGVLGAFGKRKIPDLNLAYENPGSVQVIHFRKDLYSAPKHERVEADLKDVGFKNIKHVDLSGNTSNEVVALDTKIGVACIFRNGKPLKQISFS